MNCGETKRTIQMPGCKHPEDCVRTYYLYVPTGLCDSPDQAIDVLPLVFAIHCLGCTVQALTHWEAVAETYSFVLVLPEGRKRSWNSRYCCGYALEQDLDDVGFLGRVIDEVSSEHSFVSNDIVYGMGWSNGGYMVTYAARYFRAVAPISGHQYSDLTTITAGRPTGLFMHHSENDRFVQMTGCCTDTTRPKCCCDISSHANRCTSAMQVFEEWSKEVNKCQGPPVEMRNYPGGGISCHTSTGNCRANATFCIHNAGHFNMHSFEEAFPMTNEIADFFAKDACLINGGAWSALQQSCSCQDNAHGDASDIYSGKYCLIRAKPDASSVALASKNRPVGANAALVILACVILFIVKAFISRKQNIKSKYAGWSPVSASEVDDTGFEMSDGLDK